MTHPYENLTFFVPSLADRRPEATSEEKIRGGLILIHRKAEHYRRHREEIRKERRARLGALSRRADERATRGASHRYETARAKINRAYRQGRISDETRKARILAERRRLVDRLAEHSRKREEYAHTVLQGILTLEDVERLEAYFSR
jgi:hypothetical protein